MAFWREIGDGVVGGPSILSADFAHLARDVRLSAEGGATFVHFDVMDNHFVPNLTAGPQVVGDLVRSTDLPVDVHLQVHNPDSLISSFIDAGAASLTVQPETTQHLHRTLSRIKDGGCEAGIAITPGKSPEVISPVLNLLDYVLVMSVEPGFGGQRFVRATPEKMRRVRELCDLPIQADGGITAATAPLVVAAGARVLVAGSAVFEGDVREGMKRVIDAGRSARER